MCRDADGGWVAVEIKRVATIEAVEQLCRYLERLRVRSGARRHAAESSPHSGSVRRLLTLARLGASAAQRSIWPFCAASVSLS